MSYVKSMNSQTGCKDSRIIDICFIGYNIRIYSYEKPNSRFSAFLHSTPMEFIVLTVAEYKHFFPEFLYLTSCRQQELKPVFATSLVINKF